MEQSVEQIQEGSDRFIRKSTAVSTAALLLFIGMLSQEVDDKWNTDESGKDICCGLCDLHDGQFQQRDADQQNRNCDQSGTDQRKDGRNGGLLNTLI